MEQNTQVIDLTALALPPAAVSKASELVAKAHEARIESEVDLRASGDVVVQIDAHIKLVDEDKDKVARPLKEALDNFYGLWHKARDPLVAAKATIKTLQTSYMARRDEARRAEERRLKDEQDRIAMEAAQKAEDEAARLRAAGDAAAADEAKARAAEILEEAAAAPPPALPPAPTIARGSYSSVSTRTVWKWEVVDPKQVPASYMMVNEKLVIANVKAGVREIPGIRIYSEQEAVNRR